MTSCLSALGYHESLRSASSSPPFLVQLRNIAFARAYSGDKNVSIFLGRPPRMYSKFCRIKSIIDELSVEVEKPSPRADTVTRQSEYSEFVLETWWTASCALLKEQILELRSLRDEAERNEKARFVTSLPAYCDDTDTL